MVKLDHVKKTITVTPPFSDKERNKIEDYKLIGYEVIVQVRESKIPKINKDIIKDFLDPSLQKEFEKYKKIQSVDNTGKPKFKTNKKGEKVPVTIGFRGAIAKLQKDHPEAYQKLADAAVEKNK